MFRRLRRWSRSRVGLAVVTAAVAIVAWERVHPHDLVAFLVAAAVVVALTRGTDADEASRIASISWLPAMVAHQHGTNPTRPSSMAGITMLVGLMVIGWVGSQMPSRSGASTVHRDRVTPGIGDAPSRRVDVTQQPRASRR